MHFSTDKPCNKITVGGKTVLEMDVGNGWTISDVWFNQDVPVELIDCIKVKFKRIQTEPSIEDWKDQMWTEAVAEPQTERRE